MNPSSISVRDDDKDESNEYYTFDARIYGGITSSNKDRDGNKSTMGGGENDNVRKNIHDTSHYQKSNYILNNAHSTSDNHL